MHVFLQLSARLALCTAFACAATAPAAEAPKTNPIPKAGAVATNGVPARNWVLPLFTAKEGYRNLTLRGSEVRPASTTRIDVIDLSITVFSGDAAAQVETILLSPAASFFTKEQRDREKTVRLVRDDIEVTGEGWVYEHATKKVSLSRNVRVVFSAQLNDILK